MRANPLLAALLATIATTPQCLASHLSRQIAPAKSGSYEVAMITTELIDHSHDAPFAPSPGIPRVLELSVFYPVANTKTVNTTYLPDSTAAQLVLDLGGTGLTTTSGALEQLTVDLAPPNTSIAAAPNNSPWRTLLFSPAYSTPRLLYPSLLRHIASHGFVIIAFDTAYDTSVLTLANNTAIYGNLTDYIDTDEGATLDVTARAQDASFILDHVSSNITSLIPSCDRGGNSCINTTHVGMFGHSIGGASSATALSRDHRIIGAANYNGALAGNVTEIGFSKPYLAFATQGQGMRSTIAQNQLKSWVEIWPRITAPKWWLLLNDSRHYTFSDLPVVLQKLDLQVNETVKEELQITSLSPERSEKVIATYTVAFFDFCFGAKMSRLLTGERVDFPEVDFDTVDLWGRPSTGGFGSGMLGPDARFGDDDDVVVKSAGANGRASVDLVLLATLVVGLGLVKGCMFA